MKKRLLTFILLMLGVMSVDARNSWFTNDDGAKTKNMPSAQKERVEKNRKDKERKKRAQKDQDKRDQERKKREADRKKKDRKRKIKHERDKARKEKEQKANQPKKPKLTPQAAKIIADASDAQAKMHKGEAHATQASIDTHKQIVKSKRKIQKDRASKMTKEESESHLLNVRYAPTKQARDAAEQTSCEAHGTCETAEVQDILGVIQQKRQDLTQANKRHKEAKDKAVAHHKKAGTHDAHQENTKRSHAMDQVQGKTEIKGHRRLSNTQADLADMRADMGYVAPASPKTLKKKARKAQSAMDKAKEDHRKRIERDKRKTKKKKITKKARPATYDSKW